MVKRGVVILICAFIVTFYQSLGQEVDSLLAVASTSRVDTIKVKAWVALADKLAGHNNTEAFDYARNALNLSERIGYAHGLSEAHYYLGLLSFFTGDYPNALQHYTKALDLKIKFNDKRTQANIYVLRALIFENTGSSAKALENLFSALEVYEWLDDKMNMGVCYSNIGINYKNQKEFEKSLEYFLKSKEIAQEINDYPRLATSYNNISLIYEYLNKFSAAKANLLNSIEASERIGDERVLASAYNNMARYLMRDMQYSVASEYYHKSIDIKRKQNNRLGLASSYNGLGALYLVQGQTQEALKWYREALELSTEMGAINEQLDANNGIFNCYRKLSRYSEAIALVDTLFALRDISLNEDKSRELAKLEAQFQNQKKQQEIELLNQEKELSRITLKRQRLMLLFALLGIALVVVVAAFIVVLYNNKRRSNQILLQKNRSIEAQKEEITAQKELLERQKLMLTELDELKSRFFANISHELRTPLTLILSPLTQLISKCTDKEVAQVYQTMFRNAQNLNGRIDELLLLARMEKGAEQLELVEADINQLALATASSYLDIATENGLNFTLNLAKDECTMAFDSNALEKVFSNLISNAIKFTPYGKGIEVTSAIGVNTFTFTVTDQGIGIPEADRSRVFERFYRASNAANTVGTGIGLALVKDLVSLHGGNIEVKGNKPEGAVITVTLPIISYHLDSADVKGYSSEFVDVEPYQVVTERHSLLVVEDNNDLRAFLISTLSEQYDVIEARNGEEGLTLASDLAPDIIVSDVMMPKMDGYTFTQAIKGSDSTCHIPVVLLTAKANEQSIVKGYSVEADAYLTKPFSVNHLKAVMASLLRVRARLREKFRTSITLSPSDITTNSADERFVAKLLSVVEENMDNPNLSPELLCEQAHISRTTLHNKLKFISGQSATEFINSLRLKRAAQMLKGKFGTVSEVAYAVGFNSLSYFNRTFKKHFGVNPSEFM